MDKDVLVLDGNYLTHAAKGQDLENSEGFPTSGIYRFLQTIRKQIRDRGFKSVVAVFDGGKSDRRQEILESYKEGRGDGADSKSRRNDVLKQISVLDGELLPACGIHSIRIDGYEGDDVIAVISEILDSCAIYSADKDFIQIVDDETSLIKKHPGGEPVVDVESLEEERELDPEDHLLFLAMKGDSSDAIGGIEGVGDKRAADLIKEHDGDLDAIIEACEGESAKYRQAIADSRELIERNLKLIDLSLEKFEENDLKYIYKKLIDSPSFDREVFEDVLETLEFNSFLETIDQWEGWLTRLEPASNYLKSQDEVESIMAERLSS